MRNLVFIILGIIGFSPAYAADNNDSIPEHIISVPDSLADKIKSVIEGKARIIENPDFFDPDEKVIIHGDTVPMIIKQKNFGRYDRGLFNYVFIPKGSWQFGLTASYGELNTEDIRLLDLLTDMDFNGHTFSIKPYFGYFISNNISVGMRLGYTNSEANLASLDVDFDDDINFNIDDAIYRDEAYTAAVTLRQYIGLTRRGRFGVFNEAELSFSSGRSKFNRLYNNEPTRTVTNYTDARLTFSPGLCVFMTDYLSINVSFGVFGFYLRNEKQTVNEEKSGNRFSSGANFRFNIFNINLGIGIHI